MIFSSSGETANVVNVESGVGANVSRMNFQSRMK